MSARVIAIGLAAALSFAACRDEPAPPVDGEREREDVPPPEREPDPAPAADAPPVRNDGTIFADSTLMGTSVSINVFVDPGREPSDVGAAIQAAFDEIARIESIMSEWQPDSELTRVNRGAGGPMLSLSPELTEVLARSREIAEITDGNFDPTFYTVGKLWKFTPGSQPPSDDAIAKALPLVGWQGIEIDRARRRGRLARAGMAMGLGAIAKGYAVDRASAVLRERGMNNHVVEAGGDTYASGTKDGKPWVVGIQKPGARGIVAAIPSSNESVVTSGDYQRFFEHEGTRYAHILDPKTGRPLPETESAQSVTMVAPNATDADAYATAVAVMGPTKGMAFVESRPELEAVVITHEGKVLVSSGLASRLVYP